MRRIDDLQARRKAAGWSVTELARRSTTSDVVINRLEQGARYEDRIVDRVLNALKDAPSEQVAPSPEHVGGRIVKEPASEAKAPKRTAKK